MICIAAAIVFGILALFSAKYRALAKEAWACVFRKVTLRPCQSGLDRRVRTGAMLAVGKHSPRLGRILYSIFPALSFILVLATIVSFGYLVYGGYNYALYGNCNGPGSTGFCVFDPSGPGSSAVPECSEVPHTPEAIRVPAIEELAPFKVIHPEGATTVVFVGCYSCPYTREGAAGLFDAIERFPDVRFILVDFPLAQHANSTLAANAGNCVYDRSPGEYLAYAKFLYRSDLAYGLPRPDLTGEGSWTVDFNEVDVCAADLHRRVTAGTNLGIALGVYGTPTYFIDGKTYVGPLNSRALRVLIERAQ